MKYLAEITELYEVTWKLGEDLGRTTKSIYFEERRDADKAKSLPMGDWNTKGDMEVHRYIDGKGLPNEKRVFRSIQHWVDSCLTVDQARKYGLI